MRRRRAPKRKILPDPKYRNPLIAKLINIVMECGKKSTSQRIVYTALDIIKEKTGKPPIDVFKQALPFLEKAAELNPTDRNTLMSLKQLYARLGMNDKYKEVEQKLKK